MDCECGCGRDAGVYVRTNTALGQHKGQPKRFLTGHHRRLSPVDYIEDPDTGCWDWQLHVMPNGYGRSGSRLAHRMYYEARIGSVPEGHDLHHRCDNRRCVNPNHLEPLLRAPHRRLDRRTKLTLAQAREIKAQPDVDALKLAMRYGVSRELVYGIRHGRKWPDA